MLIIKILFSIPRSKVKHITMVVPFWLINGITMVDKKLTVIALGVVLALGTIGFNWVEYLLPTAEAHGVQAQLQSRFVRIEDETFNRQSLQTGEIITLKGTLVSLVERDMRAWLSIFPESTI